MRMRRVGYIALAALPLLYCLYLATIYCLQGSLIYPGRADRVATTAPLANGAELLSLAGTGGRSEAIFLPAAATPQAVMIFAHGNGEVIDYWVNAFEGFRQRGIGVLLVEYPGYGRSAGVPSEASIREALLSAYDRIASDARVDRSRLFGYGQSLGGGAICLLAHARPLRALILQSTFTSLDTFTTGYLAPAFLLRDHFDNLSTVRAYRAPLLVIHGREDRLIPWQQGARLAAAAPQARLRLYECGHGCWDPEHLPFWQDTVPFLTEAGIMSARSP